MKHVQLIFNDKLKKYTTEKVEDRHYIKSINTYAADHADYFWNHKGSYITYDRMIELQPIAMKAGYMFTY